MMKTPDGSAGTEIPFLNPMWIQHHFHEKFVAIVVAYGNTSTAWVPVPVGGSRGTNGVAPPHTAIMDTILCHYQQNDQEKCMFFSFASALHHLGLVVESEHVRQAGDLFEHCDATSQLNAIKDLVKKFNQFELNPIIWGKKKAKYYHIFDSISSDPTLIIPWGSDSGIQHAITTVGHYIFDSTHTTALHLTKESLDWCCNAKLGFAGVYLAIRFPLKKGLKTMV